MGKSNPKCPICHKFVLWEGNESRPFCSERCRLIDLQGWLGERYRIAQDERDNSDEAQEPTGH